MAGNARPANNEGRRRTRGIGCLLVLMTGLAGLGMLGITLASFMGGGPGPGQVIERVERTHPEAKKKLAVIELRGVLLTGPSGFGQPAGITQRALDMLEHALEDDAVAGVLLHVDTPGGSVTDADALHARIKKLREKGKRVVVEMGDVCASGGYYLAVAADRVWALPTTITGSIGVIIPALNAHAFLERHGVTDESIMSGPNKAILSPTRPVSPEQRALLQGVVDSLYERFVTLVAEGRGLSVDQVRPLADGRLLTAEQARAAGLVDGVGYRDAALDTLSQLAEGGPFTVVRYEREPSLVDLLRARLASPLPQAATLEALLGTPRAMYLYAPLGHLVAPSGPAL